MRKLTDYSKYRVGLIVRSNFRAKWTGVIVDFAEPPYTHCAIVRITHDRNGKPMNKPNSTRNLRKLDCVWLEPVCTQNS